MIKIASARAAEIPGQLNNPFVAWDNYGARYAASYVGSPTYPGFSQHNAFTGSTFDFWKPNLGAYTAATLLVYFPTAITCNFAAVAAHNAGTLGATVYIERSIDGGTTWSDAGAGAINPTDNSPMAWRMKSFGNAANHWRFSFVGMTAGAPLAAAVVFLGDEVLIPSRIYDGYSPIITPTEIELQPNISVGGQFIRQSTVSQGSTVKAEFHHLDPAFIRGAWAGFQRSYNAGNPFFFGWRPSTFDDDIHYCQRGGAAIRPTNSGGLDFSTVGFDARVYEAI